MRLITEENKVFVLSKIFSRKAEMIIHVLIDHFCIFGGEFCQERNQHTLGDSLTFTRGCREWLKIKHASDMA